MGKAMERIERFVMCTTLLSVNAFTIILYILPLEMKYSFQIACFQIISLSLTLFFVTLCLYERGYVTPHDYKNLILDETARNCSICIQYKPERAHHCSTCKKCIKKMDHHCHWIGRCINYHNHGHFIRFLFWMYLNSISILSTNFFILCQILKYDAYIFTLNQFITLIVTTLVCSLLLIVSGMHFFSQLRMLAKNVTFLENLNCEHFGFQTADSPYNINLKYNFEDTLGPAKYLFHSKPKGNGITFLKKYDVCYWPKHFRFNENSYIERL